MDLGQLEYDVVANTGDLDRAEQRMDDFTQSARKGEKGVEDLGKRAKKSSRTVKKATDQMSGGMNGLSSAASRAASALAAIGVGFSVVGAVRQVSEFQATMNGLAAVSGATAQQMAMLEEQSRALGATSQFSAQQAGNAQRFLAQAGFEVNETLGATPGILSLATAGQLDLASAADIASNVLGGMRLEVDQLNRVNDVLAATASRSNTNIRQLGSALSFAAPFAASAGISIEEASAAIGVMSDAGIQGSRAGTGLIGVIRQLSNVTDTGAEVLARYGLSIADVSIETRGLQPVLETLREAGLNSADAIALFGSEAGAAAQVLVNDYSGAIDNATGEAERMADQLQQGLGPAFRSFSSAVSESVLQMGDTGLAGGLEDVTRLATGLISVWNGMGQEWAEANDIGEDQLATITATADAIQKATTILAGLTAGVVAYRTAIGLATLAQAAFNRTLIANPVGAFVAVVGTAVGALFAFREELGLVEQQASNAERRIRGLTASMQDMTNFELTQGLEKARMEMEFLVDQGQNLRRVLADMEPGETFDGRTYAEVREQYERIRDDANLAYKSVQRFEDAIEGISRASSGAGVKLGPLSDWLFDIDDGAGEASSSLSEASEETNNFASELESLRRQLDPAYAAHQDLASATDMLDQGLANGSITLSEYLSLWDAAAETYINAGDESDKLKDKTEDNAGAMATAIERGVQRMDDAFVDFWRDTISGAETTFDAFKDIALDVLAQVIHNYTTRQITASFGVGGQAGGAGGSSGGFGFGGMPGPGNIGSLLSLGQNAFAGFTGTFGSGLGVSGGVSGTAIGSANAVASGTGFQGAFNAAGSTFGAGSAGSATGLAGLQAAAPQIAIAYAAQQLIDSGLEGAGVYEALGIDTSGQGAQLGGQFGGLGGKLIGAGFDAIFGSKYSGEDPTGLLKTVNQFGAAGREGFEREAFATGALGDVGFARESRDIDTLFGDRDNFENAKEYARQLAELDNTVAQLAQSEEELDAMRQAAAGAGIQSMSALNDRYKAVLGSIGPDFAEFVNGLEVDLEQIINKSVAARGAFNALSDGVDLLGLQFSTTGAAAYDAALAMSEVAGGVQSLSAMQSRYYQTFFTQEEQFDRAAGNLEDRFSELGLALPATGQGVRNLVESFDLMTESGREQYAAVLQLVPALDQYIDGLGRQQEALRQSANDALGNLADAIGREQDRLEEQHNARMERYEERIAGVNDSIRELESFSRALESAIEGVRVESAALDRSRFMRARSVISSAAASGATSMTPALESALGVVGQDSQQFYTTFEEYVRGQVETSQDIGKLNQNTENQISVEQRTLEQLQSQAEIEQLRFEREMAGLDAQLASYQQQINALLGIDSGVMTVAQAVAQVEAAIRAINVSGAGSSGGTISQAYQDILGRAPDESGLAYYQGELESGRMDIDEIRDRIEDSPEGRGVSAFANGGMHTGGWRVVGERGPELEYTGPSRIMSNSDSRNMLDTDALRQEVAEMRRETGQLLRGILTNSDELASTIDDWDTLGTPAERNVTA